MIKIFKKKVTTPHELNPQKCTLSWQQKGFSAIVSHKQIDTEAAYSVLLFTVVLSHEVWEVTQHNSALYSPIQCVLSKVILMFLKCQNLKCRNDNVSTCTQTDTPYVTDSLYLRNMIWGLHLLQSDIVIYSFHFLACKWQPWFPNNNSNADYFKQPFPCKTQ